MDENRVLVWFCVLWWRYFWFFCIVEFGIFVISICLRFYWSFIGGGGCFCFDWGVGLFFVGVWFWVLFGRLFSVFEWRF